MPEYIERGKALDSVRKWCDPCGSGIEGILAVPTADVVSLEAYDQVRWKRDIAEKQLKSIGKSVGENMDDVAPVVRCEKCRFFSGTYCNHPDVSIELPNPDDFCSYGKAR